MDGNQKIIKIKGMLIKIRLIKLFNRANVTCSLFKIRQKSTLICFLIYLQKN
jgi:hypothetical protein